MKFLMKETSDSVLGEFLTDTTLFRVRPLYITLSL